MAKKPKTPQPGRLYRVPTYEPTAVFLCLKSGVLWNPSYELANNVWVDYPNLVREVV